MSSSLLYLARLSLSLCFLTTCLYFFLVQVKAALRCETVLTPHVFSPVLNFLWAVIILLAALLIIFGTFLDLISLLTPRFLCWFVMVAHLLIILFVTAKRTDILAWQFWSSQFFLISRRYGLTSSAYSTCPSYDQLILFLLKSHLGAVTRSVLVVEIFSHGIVKMDRITS